MDNKNSNCTNCTGCYDCHDCDRCIDSTKAYLCFNSGQLYECSRVRNSEDCRYSIGLSNCSSCESCCECDFSHGCEDSHNLYACYYCKNSSYCLFCNGLEDGYLMLFNQKCSKDLYDAIYWINSQSTPIPNIDNQILDRIKKIFMYAVQGDKVIKLDKKTDEHDLVKEFLKILNNFIYGSEVDFLL